MARAHFLLTLAVSCIAACWVSACSDSETDGGIDASTNGTDASADSSDAGSNDLGRPDSGTPGQPSGLDFFPKMAGLWSGPATDTRLGTFPLKNMDFRAAGDSVLFGRVDLDEDNSLRFAFSFEVQGGSEVLVFRNGGLFQGFSRDTRTVLVAATESTYRFCALDGGCDYVDATFEFQSETSLKMTVLVRGVPHETWTPTRVETRALPPDFPVRTDLAGDADFPPMPSASIDVTWTSALGADADVWVILSTSSCVPPQTCQFSRWIKTRASTGATSASIQLDQIHAGSYSVLGVVDANNNLSTLRLPDSGDLISVPSPTITIAPEGETSSSVAASFTIP